MWRLIVSLAFCFCGCAGIYDKLSDPVVTEKTVTLGTNLQKIGDATGFPYAGAGLAALGMVLYLMFGAPKKKSEPNV